MYVKGFLITIKGQIVGKMNKLDSYNHHWLQQITVPSEERVCTFRRRRFLFPFTLFFFAFCTAHNELLSAAHRSVVCLTFWAAFAVALKKSLNSTYTVCPCATGIMATLRQPPAMITCCVCEFVVFSQFLLQQQQLPPCTLLPIARPFRCVFSVVSLLFAADYFSSFI